MERLSQVVAFLTQGFTISRQQNQDLSQDLLTIKHSASQFPSNLKIDSDTMSWDTQNERKSETKNILFRIPYTCHIGTKYK